VEEKVHPVLKMKYQVGDDFRLPLLSYVVKFHRKNNPMEDPILFIPIGISSPSNQ
jgi:hypothetical protein